MYATNASFERFILKEKKWLKKKEQQYNKKNDKSWLLFFNWRIIDLQNFVVSVKQHESTVVIHMSPFNISKHWKYENEDMSLDSRMKINSKKSKNREMRKIRKCKCSINRKKAQTP